MLLVFLFILAMAFGDFRKQTYWGKISVLASPKNILRSYYQ